MGLHVRMYSKEKKFFQSVSQCPFIEEKSILLWLVQSMSNRLSLPELCTDTECSASECVILLSVITYKAEAIVFDNVVYALAQNLPNRNLLIKRQFAGDRGPVNTVLGIP